VRSNTLTVTVVEARVDVTFRAFISGTTTEVNAPVKVDGAQYRTPFTLSFTVGSRHVVEAAESFNTYIYDGYVWLGKSGRESRIEIVAPGEAAPFLIYYVKASVKKLEIVNSTPSAKVYLKVWETWRGVSEEFMLEAGQSRTVEYATLGEVAATIVKTENVTPGYTVVFKESDDVTTSTAISTTATLIEKIWWPGIPGNCTFIISRGAGEAGLKNAAVIAFYPDGTVKRSDCVVGGGDFGVPFVKGVKVKAYFTNAHVPGYYYPEYYVLPRPPAARFRDSGSRWLTPQSEGQYIIDADGDAEVVKIVVEVVSRDPKTDKLPEFPVTFKTPEDTVKVSPYLLTGINLENLDKGVKQDITLYLNTTRGTHKIRVEAYEMVYDYDKGEWICTDSNNYTVNIYINDMKKWSGVISSKSPSPEIEFTV